MKHTHIKENIGEKLHGIDLGNDFLYITKEAINTVKRQTMKWEKILVSIYLKRD